MLRKKEYSLYLDVVRFAAAMTVFLGHTSTYKIMTGGFLWQLADYLQTSVIVFFVLSGHVIAFVTSNKENTWNDYSSARLARLYSIVIPAVVITYLCYMVGNYFVPEAHVIPHDFWSGDEKNSPINYIATLLFVQSIWDFDLLPPNNGPFWSLSFEFFYYVLFGAAVFLKGKYRIITLILTGLICGPNILSIFPIWLMGYYVFKIQKNIDYSKYKLLKACISLLCIVIIIKFGPLIRNNENLLIQGMYIRPTVVGDYFEGLMFALHLIFVPALCQQLQNTIYFFEKPIRLLAATTFSLYLFHYPIIRLLTIVSPFNAPESWVQRVYIIGCTFIIIFLLSPWCEDKKYSFKKFFLKKFRVKTCR